MIFEDPSKKRWKVTLRLFTAIVLISMILLSLTAYSFVVNSPIPTLAKVNQEKGKAIKKMLRRTEQTGKAGKSAGTSTIGSTSSVSGGGRRFKLTAKEREALAAAEKEKSLPRFSESNYLQTAFVVQEDPESIKDLRKHADKLDVVFTDWFTFTGKAQEIDEQVDASLMDYLKSTKAMTFPRISNSDREGNWYGPEFSQYIKNPANQQNLSSLIVQTLDKYGLNGINLDFEALEPDAGNGYLDFLLILREQLHKRNKYLTVDVPMNDEVFDYEAIGQIVDAVVLMAYDEHYAGGESGSIAGQDWFANSVDDMLKRMPGEKTIVAMGQYAYDWDLTKKGAAKSMSFDEAMLLANEVGADIQMDADTKNCNYSYQDSKGDDHTVWILDAVSLWNEMLSLDTKKVYGVSLWRLGLEDPDIWGFYQLDAMQGYDPSILKKVDTLNSVNFEGDGEIIKVSEQPHEGVRNLTFDGRSIDSADYNVLPSSYDVVRFGRADSSKIALTFDDGPDPVYTPKILEILKNNGIRATFFVVGDQVQRYPDLIRKEFADGNLVGNHTYSHPNISKVSKSGIQLELNTVQRLIEALTGRQTLLFRAPYNTDTTPSNARELAPLYEVGKMGYVVVGADIDSMDYDRPGADRIVQNVLNQLKDSGSNIVVMHDAGGNRMQTVEALRALIPKLKSMGYSFVNVNDLLGVPARSLMPEIGFKEQIVVWGDKIWTFIYTEGWALIVILFFLSTVISVLRILFLGFFVLRSQRQQKRAVNGNEPFEPFVTVIVPAYNEEKVIGKTISWLLKSNYKNFEVLVVDDGSTDNTAREVEKFIAPDGKVRLASKQNGGKHSALNLGFSESQAEYVVTIDADTMILPDTIGNLMAPFRDPEVDAVCGNVQVGNIKNVLTGFQAVEYITTQNYDRRAFDELNCISVVPGATGAWKRSKVVEAGGYSDMTLTEDADITLTMLEKGAKIVYAPAAKSVTEAPETVGALFKQRFRWSYGTFQCMWKHKKSFFKGNLGRIALPNMFIFQIVFPVLSPLGDLVFLLSLFRGDMKAILSGYLLFLAMDLSASVMAFTIEKSPKKYILFVLFQRFFYRQFMYVVTFKSIFAAIKGRRHGWNKLKRTNSVNLAG